MRAPPYFFFAGGGGGASAIGADACSCTITQSLPRFSSTSVLRPSPFITSPVFGVISNVDVNVAQAMFPFLQALKSGLIVTLSDFHVEKTFFTPSSYSCQPLYLSGATS